MRILLIAPEFPDLNTYPEIRAITEMHSVSVFNGEVTLHDLYEACQEHEYDIIHFASHAEKIDQDGMQEVRIHLSGGDEVTPPDLVSLAQWAKVKCLFLNSCDSAQLATYAARRGVPAIISTNVDIQDRRAWNVPMGFYSSIAQMESENLPVDFHYAYLMSAPDTGVYGWDTSNEGYQEYLIKPIQEAIEELGQAIIRSNQKYEVELKETREALFASLVDTVYATRQQDKLFFIIILICLIILTVIPDVLLYGVDLDWFALLSVTP